MCKHHKYSSKCSQCGVQLTQDTKVAAHMVAHPIGCGFCGIMTLRTTLPQQSGAEESHRDRG